MRFSPDGKLAYVASDANGEFQQLAVVELESFRYQWLTSEIPWNVSEIDSLSTASPSARKRRRLGVARIVLLIVLALLAIFYVRLLFGPISLKRSTSCC
jgi:hypothetical protein